MTYSLYDAIQSHIRNFANQLYTCTPAIVDSYHPEDCTVDVYPAIYRTDKHGISLQEAHLSRVPLHFQATKELGMTFPVRKGDTVLLVFGHSDSEEWLVGNEDFEYPKTRRKHNINDAYAIAGVFRYNFSPVQTGTEEDFNIRYNDTYIRLKQNGDIVLSTSNGQDVTVYKNNDITINSTTTVTINCPDTNINGNVTIDGLLTTEGFISNNTIGDGIAVFNGNVNVIGDVTANGVSLETHTHNGDSGGTTSAPL